MVGAQAAGQQRVDEPDCVLVLSGDLPVLQELVNRVAYAVNRSYAHVGAELHDGDEVALIPPVSGG